jgi:hypothetical protein
MEREGTVVRSLRAPLPLISVDPRLYSRMNWVGINPFSLLAGLRMTIVAGEGSA